MINLINLVAWVLIILILIKVVLSYFMSPYHAARQFVDRLIEPMLSPIRRYVPPVGMFDFSPLVLMILIQIVASLLSRLLLMLV
jgi:YggT family protein